jgi:hypothetical protein
MLLRRSTSTWSESLIWINPRRGYSRSMITYAVTDKTAGEGDGVQYIQTTPDRHVVAGEQRTGESQRAEHPEDHQWRMNSSGLCSRRGDVEHCVQRGQEQHRRLGRSHFPRGGDSEHPYFALQLRRPRLLRFHRLHIRHLPIDLDPRVQVAAEEIAHGQLTEEGETASKGLGAIEGAIFGLLGLILAFSFSGALTRFDARRHLVVEEANDIGTAWLRVALLPADA